MVVIDIRYVHCAQYILKFNMGATFFTKKFWSHVKSNSKSSRLPKTMHLYNRFRNKSSENAELFNSYFYEQFSGPSNYNTHISWSNDQTFDIDFNRKLISSVNSNKASGPDGIHGKILKNCSESLAYPLSLQHR